MQEWIVSLENLSNDPHFALLLAVEMSNIDGLALALQLPTWMFRTLASIPGAAKGYWQFINFCIKQLDNRIAAHSKSNPDKPDIIHALIEHYNKNDNKKELYQFLAGDSRLIIVAGSDTTAATLSYLFYHIASKPEWQTKLRDELHRIKKENDSTANIIPDLWLKDAQVLNGMINEALRLNPPVPSGVFRQAPPEGALIGDTFIPGNTVVQMPMYAMSRDHDNWVKPEEFLPERWYSKPELIREKDAFFPFSTGPYGCIGKNLGEY